MERSKSDINGVTDTEGKFVIEGKTTGNEIEIDVEKEGYYRASKKECLAKMGEEYEVKDGPRWNLGERASFR